MFTAVDIQARLRVRPFLPVRFITSSGQAYEVTHPELVLVGRRFAIISVSSNEHPSQFETANQVAIMHISDLQDIPRPPSGATNGAG